MFFSSSLFSQIRKKLPVATPTIKTNTVGVKRVQPDPANIKHAPAPTDLQKAVVNIVVGDDGKDYDTQLVIMLYDQKNRLAAYMGELNARTGQIMLSNIGEYLPGDNETLSMVLFASIPTGETKVNFANLPMPVTRESDLADFQDNNGGYVRMVIKPNGHDTWKLKTFSITLIFNNDPSSSHTITWDNRTMSQNNNVLVLEFDKDFNPIQ